MEKDTYSVHYEGIIQLNIRPRRISVYRVKNYLHDSRPRYERMSPCPEPARFSWADMDTGGQLLLAEALIYDATGDIDCVKRYSHDFRMAFVKAWGGDWRIDRDQIRRWIQAREWNAEQVRKYKEDTEKCGT